METPQAASCGELLRQFRGRAGLTQEELAEAAGLSVRGLSDLERGVNKQPRAATLHLLAQALGLSPRERAALYTSAHGAAPGRVTTDLPTRGEGLQRHGGAPHDGRAAAAPSHPHSALPAGTVTFLFTDIEGSTQRWERHPAAMRAVLARHDALLHDGIRAHGGVVVTERGEGDSFFALFARASDALVAACALQRALVAEPWPQEVAPLRVRMALHTGEAGMREGADYRGVAVNRCARLRAVAHGGQVLLSEATYELVRDLLPPEVTVRALGTHRLKDLTRPEQIYQLLHPDLPADFPPLMTLDQQRHNLPVQSTALVGREREVQEVRERLLEPETRLLTLTGPGGTGKTRLGLQVAVEALEAFPDGAFFVNLAPLSDQELVLPTIALTLGIVESGGQPLRETLHAFLREMTLLLLLDNFEQLLEAAPTVSDLLAACAGVRVLATSRAALHLHGERLYPVPPLALPEVSPLPPLERLTQYEAVRLFIERARDVRPDFAVTNATAPAVAEICVRLDGLPLAIELAAAWVRLLSPQALLSRLSSRLGVLTGGARDLPERQRTLRATIAWSYGLLTQEEQTLFARLSVFLGGRTLEAIEAVCNPEGTYDVLGGVDSLLEKNLLVQTEAEGETRFVILETIHEYAREQLEASGEAETLRRQHAAYYLALAEEARAEIAAVPRAALERLDREHDNLRAAFRWLIERGETERALRLGSALHTYWGIRGYLAEGQQCLAEATAQSGAVEASIRAKALADAGDLAIWRGDYVAARALLQESLEVFRAVEDWRGLARAQRLLGRIARYQGACADALPALEESLRIGRVVDDPEAVSRSLFELGMVARQQGDSTRAQALLDEAVAVARPIRNPAVMGTLLYGLGRVATDRGAYAQARALYAESTLYLRELGFQALLAFVLEACADLDARQGQAGRALRLVAVAAALRERVAVPLPPALRLSVEHTAALARQGLNAVEAQVAWAEGSTMPLEQALAAALEQAAQP